MGTLECKGRLTSKGRGSPFLTLWCNCLACSLGWICTCFFHTTEANSRRETLSSLLKLCKSALLSSAAPAPFCILSVNVQVALRHTTQDGNPRCDRRRLTFSSCPRRSCPASAPFSADAPAPTFLTLWSTASRVLPCLALYLLLPHSRSIV